MGHTGSPARWKRLPAQVLDEITYAKAVFSSGAIRPMGPAALRRAGISLYRYGLLGGAIGLAAARTPGRPAIIDELGTLTFREADNRSNALANAWRARGLRAGDGVAILVRNHRGILESLFAAAKCGARIILLNTDFAGPQMREVAAREGTDLLVYDEEYQGLLAGLSPAHGSWRAWADTPGDDTLEALIAGAPDTAPPDPGRPARIILLTSGTSGTPKGAPRPDPSSLAPAGILLDRIPFRSGEVTAVAAPIFHTLGLSQAILAIGIGSTLVLHRRFAAQQVIDSLARHHATALIVVPVMLARILEELENLPAAPPLALRIIVAAGSQLGPDLVARAQRTLGPVVYNLYGSTECAYATVATPADLRARPGTVGRPLRGVRVKILDEHGDPVPAGTPGRVFIGNSIPFEGYTGGGGKELIDGLLCSGDIGHFDSENRLYIDGRDDDMIVSGGENVFPGEVEDLLATHPGIREVACIGVPDSTFGQRLKAFAVLNPGASCDAEELSDFVRASLARYKVPREFVFLGELPRNPTGKVLKRQLRQS